MKRNSLVLLAVTGAVGLSMTASAASYTAGDNRYSKEYSERAIALGSPTSVALRRNIGTETGGGRLAGDATRDPTFVLSSAANSGDVVTINLGGTAGAQFVTTSAITLRCRAAATAQDGSGTQGTAVGTATMTATSATTTLTGNCGAGDSIDLVGGRLTIASLQTVGTITLDANITRSGSSIDTATASEVARVVQELNASVTTAFDGVIDNSAGSKLFAAAAVSDVMTITYTNVDVFQETDVTPATDDAAVVTLGGDFAYLNDDGTAGCVDADLAGNNGTFVNAANTNTSIDTGCSTITITQSAANVSGASTTVNNTVSVTSTLGASNWLKNQTFTGSVVLKWTAASNAVAQSRTVTLTPGSFTGSGATVFIPYMPVGANISQILYVTNTANVAGTLTMSAYDDSGVACSTASFGGNIAVGARRVTNLASALAAGIAACGGAATSKKWYLTITATLPDSALEVYSAYNVGGSDRANVINSSNGRATATGMGNANSNGAN